MLRQAIIKRGFHDYPSALLHAQYHLPHEGEDEGKLDKETDIIAVDAKNDHIACIFRIGERAHQAEHCCSYCIRLQRLRVLEDEIVVSLVIFIIDLLSCGIVLSKHEQGQPKDIRKVAEIDLKEELVKVKSCVQLKQLD